MVAGMHCVSRHPFHMLAEWQDGDGYLWAKGPEIANFHIIKSQTEYDFLYQSESVASHDKFLEMY